MKLNSLTTTNFRTPGTRRFEFDSRFNVLDERRSKDALEAAAILLCAYTTKFAAKRLNINDDGEAFPVEIVAEIERDGETFLQSCVKKSANKRTSFAGRLAELGERDARRSADDEYFDLPCVVYYDEGRFAPFRNLDLLGACKVESRSDGYADSLSSRRRFSGLQRWALRRELIAFQKKQADVPLEFVRQTARTTIPDCSNVYYWHKFQSVCVEFGDEELVPLRSLDEATRGIFSLTVDLARRIAIANPHLGTDSLRKTSGVVLIDLIDKRLRDEQYERFIDNLKVAFPNVQFITTTCFCKGETR